MTNSLEDKILKHLEKTYPIQYFKMDLKDLAHDIAEIIKTPSEMNFEEVIVIKENIIKRLRQEITELKQQLEDVKENAKSRDMEMQKKFQDIKFLSRDEVGKIITQTAAEYLMDHNNNIKDLVKEIANRICELRRNNV